MMTGADIAYNMSLVCMKETKIISFITIAFIPIEIVINKMADEMK